MENEVVLFRDGEVELEVQISPDQETVWLSSNQMSDLFDRDEKTIRKHVNKLFSDGEIEYENNTQKMRVALENKCIQVSQVLNLPFLTGKI